VVGRDVPYTVLAGIVGGRDEALREGLGHLLAAEFIYETSLFPDLVYAFKHALTHEVAYSGLLHSRRKALHAATLNVMESRYRDRLDEHVPQLAQHALRADDWSKAVLYSRQAAARALAQSAARKAAEHIDRALGALANLPDDRSVKEEAFALYDIRRNAFQVVGDLEEIDRSIREANILAESLGDPARWARVAGVLANYLQVIGRVADGVAQAERAVALAQGVGTPNLLRQSHFYLGQTLYAAGRYQHAALAFEQARTAIQAEALGSNPDGWLAASQAELGDFPQALRAIEAAHLHANAARSSTRVTAFWAAGMVLMRLGDAERAVTELRRGLAVAEEQEVTLWRPIVSGALGLAEAMAGDTTAARARLEETIAIGEARLPRIVPLSMAWLAETHLLEGRIGDATTMAEKALELARTQEAHGDAVWCALLLGNIALMRGDLLHAETLHREAHATAAAGSRRPLVAHCHLGLGKLYRRTGKHQEAQEHLTTATTMYREMDMRFYLEQAEAEMGA
jgi:tetratricopeptide (TPR) repeat protein